MCVDQPPIASETSLSDPNQFSETTAVPVLDSSLAESTLVRTTVPAVPPSVTGVDVQPSVISTAAELESSTSNTSSIATTVTDHGDKQLVMAPAMPPAITLPMAETVANGIMPNMSENFFCKRLPVPKRQRNASKSRRACLVSFALTSSAHLADVKAREAKRSKQKAAPKRMPKPNRPHKSVGGHPKETKKSQDKVKRGAENSKQNNQADPDYSCDSYCARCEARYGDPADKKLSEEWIACCQCDVYFHESCAEEFGILDDETFTCQTCL